MEEFIKERKILNELMEKQDDFFKLFSKPLDTQEWLDAAIPKKYIELMGIAISLAF